MKKRTVKIATGLGASVVRPLSVRGLQVTFVRPLVRVKSYGYLALVSTIFPFSCLKGFDVDKGWLILADDYQVWQNLDSGVLMFRSSDLLRPPFFICKQWVASIKVLPSGKFLFPTS